MLTITLAAVLAVLGTGLVLAYVHKANTRAIEGMQAVTVIVAKTDIPSGTSAGAALREGMLASQKLPASSVPSDAVRSITSDLDPLVTSASMQSGQLLLRPTLVRAAQTTGGVAIPPGMVAVTVQLCVQEAVAGYVHAGSSVAVFDTFPVKGAGMQRTCDVSHQVPAFTAIGTQILLSKAEVLSVGIAPQSTPSTTTSPGTSALSSATSQGAELVTLAVSQVDAERVIQVAETGMPYLALLTPESHTHNDTGPVQLFKP
jgi:pilus assembly protein CpaB